MAEPARCPHCQAELPPNSPEGLCVKCLYRAALQDQGDRHLHVSCPHCHNPIELVDDSSLSDITCPSCDSRFSLVGDETITYRPDEQPTIGHFQLREKIGAGAFGTVWKALDTELDRIVAVKIPRKDQLDPKAAEQFFREARAAAQLKHPNIVSVHEIGRDEDTIYIVSDFVEGVSLADWLTGQQLTPREAAELCAKIAEALHHAHENGVVHRDLKPSNIMLGSDLEPHIMDFGLAKREAGEITMTLEGKVLGTPAYMSPEQAKGEAHAADRRSDVYSLGVILYELLTGERPFRGSMRMLLHQVINDEPPSPRRINSDIPQDLGTICLKCLEKNPRHRYGSSQELADELKRYIQGRPINARPIRATARAWRWRRRNPVVAALSIAVMVSLVAGTVISSILANLAFLEANESQRQESLAKEALNESQRQESLVKEALWQSKVEQARALRLAGDRSGSLDALADATRFRPTPMVRQEVVQTILSAGLSPQLKLRIDETQLARSPRAFSYDGKVLALQSSIDLELDGGVITSIEHLTLWEISSGRQLGQRRLHKRTKHQILDWRFWFGPNAIVAIVAPENRYVFWNPNTNHQEVINGVTPAESSWPRKLSAVVFNQNQDSVALRTSGQARHEITTQVWNYKRRRFEGTELPGSPVAFVDDDELVVANGPNLPTKLRRVNFRTGQEVHSTPIGLEAWAISGDGRTAALLPSHQNKKANDSTITIWDLAAGEQITSLQAEIPRIVKYPLLFSPDGQWLVFEHARRSNTIGIWNRSTGDITTMSGLVDANVNTVQPATFSPDGRLLAAYRKKGKDSLQIIDVARGKVVSILREHHSPIWSPDGRWLATIGITDAEEANRPDRQFERHVQIWGISHPPGFFRFGSAIQWLRFSPDGKKLAVNGTAWNIDNDVLGPAILRTDRELDRETTIFFDQNNQPYILGCPKPRIHRPDRISQQQSFWLSRFGANGEEVKLVAPKVEPRESLRPNAIPILSCDPQHMAISSDAKLLAMACYLEWAWDEPARAWVSGNDQVLAVWDLETSKPTLLWHRVTPWRQDGWSIRSIKTLAFSLDSNYLATAGFNHKIALWNAREGTLLDPIDKAWYADKLVFRPEGRQIISTGSAQTGRPSKRECVFCVSDVESRKVMKRWELDDNYVRCVALDPKGRLFATGTKDQVIRLWEIPSGRELARWQAHDDALTALAFSPDGNTLASGSADGTLKLWSIPRIRDGLISLGCDW